jgi:flagellar biosynthesis GTPase FlhF
MGSKIVPIIFVVNKLTVLYFFLVIIMIVFSILKTKKTWKYSLLKLDDKQRLITALEHEDMEDELSIMQREDAISYVASIDIKKELPIIFWYKEQALKISIAAVVLLIVLFVPPFHNAQINKIEAASEIKKEVLKEINDNKKLIQDMKLENQLKKDIMNALDKTKKELKKSNVKKDYKKDIEKQKKSLEDMIRKTQDALKKKTEGMNEQSKLLEELLKLDNLENLQSVLEKYQLNDELLKDLQNLSKMQDSLKELLKNIDPKALENIMKNLQKELSSFSCSQTDSQNGQNQGGT